MYKLLILSALVAACFAQATLQEHCCSSDDRTAVIEQWNSIWNTPDSNRVKTLVGRAIFDRFLAEDPEATSLFDRVNVADKDSGEFNAHMLRVLGGVDLLVNMLKDVNVLREEADHLAAQHREREGVTVPRVRAFLEIMMDEMPKVLTEFNGDAWRSCFIKFFQVVGN